MTTVTPPSTPSRPTGRPTGRTTGRPPGRHIAPRPRSYAGLSLLARLAWRRSRVFYVVWIAFLWGVTVATVAAYERVVPPGADAARTLAVIGANPTMRAMLGPPFDLLTAGGFTMWRVGTFVATGAAFMAAFGVVRGTRADEEDGRTELVRAGVVGRHAPLGAAVAVAALACLALALLVAASLARLAPPVSGAVATGVGIGLTGLLGAGLGAVAAQLSESARAARSIASGVLGAAYLLRAMADGSADSSSWRPLAWASPVEWAALARPYAAERWWALLLPGGLAVLLVSLAVRLERARDLGAGLRTTRPGPASAAAGLGSAEGLARRLHRPSVVGWTVGTLAFGLVMGTLSDAFGTMMDDLPELAEIFRRMGGGAQVMRDAFYVAIGGLGAVALAVLGVQLLGRLHREEDRGHAELLLSASLTRARLAASHLVPALVVPAVLAVVFGAALALPQALQEGRLEPVGSVSGALLVLVPGIWLTVGIAMLCQGWLPRWPGLPWAVVAWTLAVAWIGEIVGLPEWAIRLTPFAALPRVPVEPMVWTPVLATTAVAAVLVVAGVVGFRRRDLPA